MGKKTPHIYVYFVLFIHTHTHTHICMYVYIRYMYVWIKERLIQLPQGYLLLSMSYFILPDIIFSITNWESMVLLMYKWFESDTERSVINGFGFHAIQYPQDDVIERTDHVLRYADDAKLGWLLIFWKTNIKLQITVTKNIVPLGQGEGEQGHNYSRW